MITAYGDERTNGKAMEGVPSISDNPTDFVALRNGGIRKCHPTKCHRQTSAKNMPKESRVAAQHEAMELVFVEGRFCMNLHVVDSEVVSYCPFCSSSDIHDTNLRALDDTSRRLYLVYECKFCTGRFVADRPDRIEKVEDETAAAFASPERIAEQRAHFAWKRIFDENDYPYSLIPLIERWAPGRRVLDLGCGASQLLPMLMKRGFDVVGFEGDPARAQVARENGVTIVSGDWRKIGDIVGTNRFDCIVSDQVFEHMLDPVGTLRSLKSLLAEGGVLIFRFPNEGSWRRKSELAWARFRGNRRPLSYFVDHWNYFNERAARSCFSAADYEVLRVKKDLSLHGFLVRKVFPQLEAIPGLPQLIARTIAAIDSNALSNGLTVIARPS